MLNSLQLSLIERAREKHGEILPINGDTFQEKHFTTHKGKDGEWVYFWFNHLNLSSGLIKQQINCPQLQEANNGKI